MKYAGFPIAVVLAASAVALAGTAAQAKMGRHFDVSFEELDIDNDGQITAEELAAHRAARFDKTDTDGDGKLSRDELLGAAKERSEKRVDRMIGRFDDDGDGSLSREEMPRRHAKKDGGRFFKKLDADGSGAISKEEFETARERMQEHHGKRKKSGDKG